MALEFDGVNDIIDCGAAPSSVDQAGAFTVFGWIKPDGAGEGNNGFILANHGASSSCWSLRMDTSEEFGLAMVTDASFICERTTNGNAAPTGVWTPIALTYQYTPFDADGIHYTSIRLFSNGVETSYLTENPAETGNPRTTETFRIGNRPAGDRTYDGCIDELSIWDVVLSDAVIAQLSKSFVRGLPLAVQPANLVAYWPLDDFDEGVTATGSNSVRDLSGNALHGTPSNGPVGRKSKLWLPGRNLHRPSKPHFRM